MPGLNPERTKQADLIRKGLPANVPDHVRRRLMGTSASNDAPWETWASADPLANCSPELKAEIAEYSQKHHGRTSSQNLELLMQHKEMNREMVKEYRFYNQDDCVIKDAQDVIARKGKIMHCLEFLDRLCTIRPAYLSANIRRGLTGLAVYHPKDVLDPETGGWKRVGWHYVCGVQAGYMWEYSVLNIDDHGLPTNEKWRGYRTVILRLIQSGHITEEQALKAFGEPSPAGAKRYLEQLYYWRNRKEETGKTKDE
jgi:hypothetical protein